MSDKVLLENVQDVLLQKTKEAQDLYALCEKIPDVVGKAKLLRRIKAELKFFLKLKTSQNLKKDSLCGTNLPCLSAIVECCYRLDGVVKVLAPFNYIQTDFPFLSKRIDVDVVADNGKTWVKVVARNPDALLLVSRGGGKFGQKPLVERIKEFKECALQNDHMFEPPKIKVCFAQNTDEEELCNPLRDMNVEILCLGMECPKHKNAYESLASKSGDNVMSDCKSVLKSSENQHSSFNPDAISSGNSEHLKSSALKCRFTELGSNYALTLMTITSDMVLNLDVSSMIAHTSNLTNGCYHMKFADKILTEQAENEILTPVRPELDKLFEGHKLICCTSAYSSFVDIFTCIGGPKEKRRAFEFLSDVIIVPDNPSPRAVQLQKSSKISKRSKIVFGTGDTLKAVTVTANVGFIRAAQSQGEKFVAFLHESRALSEMKELPSL